MALRASLVKDGPRAMVWADNLGHEHDGVDQKVKVLIVCSTFARSKLWVLRDPRPFQSFASQTRPSIFKIQYTFATNLQVQGLEVFQPVFLFALLR